MKFTSKHGIGEIVAIENLRNRAKNMVREGRTLPEDHLAEVLGVQFTSGGIAEYLCEISTPYGMQRAYYREEQLVGDPTFDQDTGLYPVAAVTP